MFSRPSPEFILSLPSGQSRDTLATRILDGQNVSKTDLERLKNDMCTPLSGMKESDGKSVGFFEQGLFTGLVVEATVAVGLIAICAKYAIPLLMRKH
jgi:hypothetical protein